jgi:hypothetical protein
LRAAYFLSFLHKFDNFLSRKDVLYSIVDWCMKSFFHSKNLCFCAPRTLTRNAITFVSCPDLSAESFSRSGKPAREVWRMTVGKTLNRHLIYTHLLWDAPPFDRQLPAPSHPVVLRRRQRAQFLLSIYNNCMCSVANG